MRNRKNIRGGALTELMILTLPYGLLLIGTVVLGTLAMGRQECQKAVILATQQPGEQNLADLGDYAFAGLSDEDNERVRFEDQTGYEPDAEYATEEPVFPLRDSSEAGDHNDVHALFIRLARRATSSTQIINGQPVTNTNTVTTGIGNYLDNLDIMPGSEDDIAHALNGWLTFSRARARFSFAYGGTRLQNEGLPEEEERGLRGEFNLYGHGGEEGIHYFYATREDDPNEHGIRGNHVQSGTYMGKPVVDSLDVIGISFERFDDGLYNDSAWGVN